MQTALAARRRTLAAIAATAAIALLAAGCGVKEGSGSTGAPASAANAAGCTGRNDPSAKDPAGLTLALVPSGDAKKLVESVKPLEAALTQRLGIPVKGVISQDYQAAVEAIGADQAQIGFLPSLQMIQACTRYGAESVLQTERNKKISYAAQFFTNNPSKYCADTPAPAANGMLFCNGTAPGAGPAGLEQLPKLRGATMSLLQAASPAGYIFPVAAMKAAGLDAAKDITPVQVTANDASVLAVYRGDAEVGASYWDARTVVKKDTPDVGAKVVVFALTEEIPNDGVSLSGKLSPAWQQKITTALTDYAATPDGVAALTAIYQITGLKPADKAALQRTQAAASSIGLG